MTKYKALIGLEMHCEISEVNTKVFSSAKNSYSDTPNCNIRPVDMGFPGTLPVVNKKAVEKALMASIILNCKQPEYIYFERKNYYYPDLPKGYQITQETKPAPVGIYGHLDYECNDDIKTVRINNIHLEEDAASLDHYSTYSTRNYNRAGVPLLELVTYPDFHTADEAVSFLETMRSIYKYAGISEADSKKGQIRCDVNVSIMDIDADESIEDNWGTKVEIKNVNSFGGVRDAINYEIERQIDLKENGTYSSMEQQTRRWDEESMTTIYMRSKVNAIDYKYFIEPNIPKFKIDPSWIKKISESIPTLASARKEKYINVYNMTKTDANTLVKEKEISDFFEETIELGVNPKHATNWITSNILGYLNKHDLTIKDISLTPKMLKDLIDLVENKTISSKQAKEVLTESLSHNTSPLEIVKKNNITQNTNTDEILEVVKTVLEEQPKAIEDYKNGKVNITDYLVGQIMKKTKGKANPSIAMELIKQELDRR